MVSCDHNDLYNHGNLKFTCIVVLLSWLCMVNIKDERASCNVIRKVNTHKCNVKGREFESGVVNTMLVNVKFYSLQISLYRTPNYHVKDMGRAIWFLWGTMEENKTSLFHPQKKTLKFSPSKKQTKFSFWKWTMDLHLSLYHWIKMFPPYEKCRKFCSSAHETNKNLLSTDILPPLHTKSNGSSHSRNLNHSFCKGTHLRT